MKRQQDRDLSPKNKRTRGPYLEHEDRERDYVMDIRRGDNRGGAGNGRPRNNAGMGGRDLLPDRPPKNMKREPVMRSERGGGREGGRSRDFDFEDRPQRRVRDFGDRPSRGDDHDFNLSLRDLDHLGLGAIGSSGHHSNVRSMNNTNRQGQGRFSQECEVESGMQPLPEYRTLCVSNLNQHVPDDEIKEALLREFERYGEFNIRIVHTGDNFRIAYVNFRFPEDARRAKLASQDMVLFDKLAQIGAVYQYQNNTKRPRSLTPDRRSGHGGGNDNFSGGRRESTDRVGRVYNARGEPNSNNFERGHPRGGDREKREPKFPFYLHHIDPEDDEKATRTLFVGSLGRDIGEAALKEVFERFGYVEDIDIKRMSMSQGNPYAFVRFLNLDMAHAAKVEMSGEYIGGMQCKIGYGKANMSPCLWIGGLGPYILPEELEREFKRFGVIKKFEWLQGRNYAYVLYDDIEAAKSACHEMRGFPIAPNKRLRIDYADETHMSDRFLHAARDASEVEPATPQNFNGGRNGREGSNHNWEQKRGSNEQKPPGDKLLMEQKGPNRRGNSDGKGDWGSHNRNQRNQDMQRGDQFFEGRKREDRFNNGGDRRRPSKNMDNERGGFRNRGHHDMSQGKDQDRNNERHSPPFRRGRNQGNFREDFGGREDQLNVERNRQHEDTQLPMGNVQQASTINDLAKCLPVVWRGALVLKNSSFLTKMHLVSGDVHLVDNLMRDPSTTETPCLRITQRLRLDQPKLDEMIRRVCSNTQSGQSVLLAMPGLSQTSDDPSTEVQQRPLKNLVTYFKQKESAGVISLPPYQDKDRSNVGVLHAFPPCQFSQDFLSKRAPSLKLEVEKDEYLVIVVVRGAALNI